MALQSDSSINTMPLSLLSESSFTQLVNEAFRNYQSTLALSRSPLANSALVAPTLIVDDASPTAEERGRGLRLLLRWAVEQIAPEAVIHPIGTLRPFDDPTWSRPLWWRYNLLRHRYVEPLHPDEFIEGGRFTETLMALTGISSSDAFFDERSRAIREVAERLRQQLVDGAAHQVLQDMALGEIVRLLENQEEAAQLLGIAAIFEGIFPRALLLQIAATEQLRTVDQALSYLITHRLLLAGDGRQSLWLSPVLRRYIYQRQSSEARQRWHRLAARHYETQELPLETARHWQQAHVPERAVSILFVAAETLINELQVAELIQSLLQFQRRSLSDASWREVQILLSDLYYRAGQPEDALAACRQAQTVAETSIDQARIYRRMGKIYEGRNQLHSLTYYQEASERFDPTSPELADLLKDRGWLHILRRNWRAAEQDLSMALSIAPEDDDELQADIVDALASLYRRQKHFEIALQQARRALAIREGLGNLPRVASSFNNLGNIYRDMGEYWHAISAYEEALVTYQRLGNSESIAGALLNIGMAHQLLEENEKAAEQYEASLAICQQQSLPHIEATLHYNLTETYSALRQAQRAQEHWHQGYEVSQKAGFADEMQAFEQLYEELPLLHTATPAQPIRPPEMVPPLDKTGTVAMAALPPEEQEIIILAQQYGRIAAKDLVEALHVSRATATRRLSALAEDGHLEQHGKGRGTYYALPDQQTSLPQNAGQGSAVLSTAQPLPEQQQQLAHWLASEEEALQEHFAIEAITLTDTVATRPLPRLSVRFRKIPTLTEFWALRRHLERQWGQSVDLVPELPTA